MEKILKKNDVKQKRVFAECLTIGIMKKADIPLSELKRLKEEGFSSTKDFWLIQAIMNAALIQGDPITDDEPFENLEDLQKEFEHFLLKSRVKSTEEKLKEKRSPRR